MRRDDALKIPPRAHGGYPTANGVGILSVKQRAHDRGNEQATGEGLKVVVPTVCPNHRPRRRRVELFVFGEKVTHQQRRFLPPGATRLGRVLGHGVRRRSLGDD